MPCYHPLQAYQGEDGVVTFSELRRHGSQRSLQLSCGQCVGCRLERSRQWAVRCMHEAQMHEQNCFITLTYDKEDLPKFMSLRYRDFQLFMKKLRKRAPGVRFFMCGEYGGKYARPHFHACLFGFDFADKYYWSKSESGAKLYRSPLLETLWQFGFSTVGSVTFESAAYVARYVMKKVTGDAAERHYENVDKETGEIVARCPEFCHMSLGRKPGDGIGGRWLKKFWSDVFPHGKAVVNGVECNTPRYYDRTFKRLDSDGFAGLATDREIDARRSFADRSDDRLAVREVVAEARIRKLKRSI